MDGHSTYVPKSGIARWFEQRLPIVGLVHSSFVAYPVPRNLNYMWTFGAILSFMLGDPDPHRRHSRDALRAERDPGVRVDRAHHARRQLSVG